MNLSVLLSVYNKENPNYLVKSLDSIFSQTQSPVEVILVKDGPLNNELDGIIDLYVSQYPNLKVFPLVTNQGLGKALNEGLKHCSYDIVARMDTDDIAKPDRFEKQLAIFEKYSDIDVVGAWIDEFEDDISEVKSVRKLPELPDDIRQFAKRRNPINHPVVMFRKSAVLAAGGYQHFPLFEDYYLWIRMLMNGAKFYNIQESLLYFRFSPEMFKRRGYLRQDSLYLAHYSRVLTHIASRLTEKEHIAAFIRFASDGIEVEEALHGSFLKGDVPAPEEISPTCLLYTSVLQAQATAPVEVEAAAVLPCFWVYQQVGRQIIARQQGSGNPYAQWIETYADPSFTEATSQAIGICDALAEKTGPETRRRMTDIFLRCTKMEWLFWDSAWYLESWKI